MNVYLTKYPTRVKTCTSVDGESYVWEHVCIKNRMLYVELTVLSTKWGRVHAYCQYIGHYHEQEYSRCLFDRQLGPKKQNSCCQSQWSCRQKIQKVVQILTDTSSSRGQSILCAHRPASIRQLKTMPAHCAYLSRSQPPHNFRGK